MVSMQTECLQKTQEEILQDDKAMRPSIHIKTVEETVEEYVENMLSYFKRERLNINKRLKPSRCQNIHCKTYNVSKGSKRARPIQLDCCSKCNRVSYCSKECQSEHYPLHKETCKYWAEVWDKSNLVTLKVTGGDL